MARSCGQWLGATIAQQRQQRKAHSTIHNFTFSIVCFVNIGRCNVWTHHAYAYSTSIYRIALTHTHKSTDNFVFIEIHLKVPIEMVNRYALKHLTMPCNGGFRFGNMLFKDIFWISVAVSISVPFKYTQWLVKQFKFSFCARVPIGWFLNIAVWQFLFGEGEKQISFSIGKFPFLFKHSPIITRVAQLNHVRREIHFFCHI